MSLISYHYYGLKDCFLYKIGRQQRKSHSAFSMNFLSVCFFSIISFRSLCSEKNIGEEKNSLYHGLSVSVIIEDTFQFTVNAKYNICFGKQFIQNGGNICFKQGIIV